MIMTPCLLLDRALDPVPKVGEQISTTTLGIPTPMAGPELINPTERMMPIHGDAHPDQREPMKLRIASPSSEIIGEGATIFTDMTEMILDVFDKQVDMSPGSQQHTKGLSPKDDQKEKVQSEELRVSAQKEDYPCRSLVFSGTVHWFEGRQAFIHYCGLHQVLV